MIIPESAILYINIFIIFIYITMMILAYKKGFIYGLVNFFGFLLALAASWFVAPILANNFPLLNPEMLTNASEAYVFSIIAPLANTVIWFAIVLLVLNTVLSIIMPVFKIFSHIPVLGFLNRLAGAFFGFINATIWVLIISMILSLPFFQNGAYVKQNSLIKYVNNISDKAILFVANNIDLKNIEDYVGNEVDVQQARDQFESWLKQQGIINE